MPRPRKHATPAERQAAYRRRCEQARQATLAATGLPGLPTIPTVPGRSRWDALVTTAQELIASRLHEMQEYYDDRSERWQESERGQEYQEQIDSTEAVLEALGDLIP
jgi:Tfp pilus assembly protein PilN